MLKHLFFFLFIAWTFEQGYRDQLQRLSLITGAWEPVIGPYSLSADGSEYMVPVFSSGPAGFFRVYRQYGTPDLVFFQPPPQP